MQIGEPPLARSACSGLGTEVDQALASTIFHDRPA
ncbi:unnamed protein product [Amoebophrya sp. A25]|nr:unnamed protein product [Amoebophrya sp. A25]|eukprot:GSA25T00015324001.1